MFSLRDLECFMAVAEHKTFSRAAKSLRMAQPPLSRRVADLERQLGTALFIRGPRQVQLTEAGLALVREGRTILTQANLTERIVRETAQGSTGHIRIGYVGSAGFDIVPRAIRHFRELHPRAGVSVVHLWTHQTDALRFRAIDIALVGGIVDSEECRGERLATNRLVAAVPADHPLAARERIGVAELATEPFISLPRYGSTGLHDLIRSVFASQGYVPKVVQEVEGHDMLIACVAAGLGVSLVNSVASALPIRNVAYREIDPESPPLHLTALVRAKEDNSLVPPFVDALRVALLPHT